MNRQLAPGELEAIENQGTTSRTTAGRSKYHGVDPEGLELMHRYLRDVHGPAIARRAGIHTYRRHDLGPVEGDLVPGVEEVKTSCDDTRRMTGVGSLDYRDADALTAFYESPDKETRALLLQDLNVIGGAPGWTTTYRTLPGNGWTFIDRTGSPTPQGPVKQPRYAMWLRRRGTWTEFGPAIRRLAASWSSDPEVQRLRLQLFEDPDAEVERSHGYPVHPPPEQEHYNAWIDLIVSDAAVLRRLVSGTARVTLTPVVDTLHVQSVNVVYTYVWNGLPTEVGLRGYSAFEVIERLGAQNQREPRLLEWLYGRRPPRP